MPHTVRLTPGDASAYRALMLQAYAQHPQAFTSSVAERAALPLIWWEQRLSDASRAAEVVLGVRRDDHLVAAVGLGFDVREKARHKATLFGMYVAPNARQQGLGAALVQRALACARSRVDVKLVQLTVTEGNHAAQALYERHGFVTFGLEPMAVAVGNDFVAKVHMWRLL
ncbi:GNAT family N-acetyltransferase [Rhodoferax sp.]|uniref:GNAT family N-acetyltransferase n=1 Tax=Rhodoferax sp. TaxID=50421 RepID=UPI00284BC1E8|nr:GNAT family N-acetyltransferase [Rhodoferax sp.]MDR3370171.1 GNAT family N-acetyltransferase [Rhodoferax sp.]